MDSSCSMRTLTIAIAARCCTCVRVGEATDAVSVASTCRRYRELMLSEGLPQVDARRRQVR